MINTDSMRLTEGQKIKLKEAIKDNGVTSIGRYVIIGDVERFDDLQRYLSNLVDFNDKAKPLTNYDGVTITQKKSNAILKEINKVYREMQRIEKRM